MDRNSVIKFMRDKGAFFVSQLDDRPCHFNFEKLATICGEAPNLWMVLGEESSDLVAIVIENVSPKAADCFLPQTGLIFGTRSGSRGYRVYRCSELCPNRTLRTGERSYVELRGEGKSLMLPSSEPVSGEMLEFCAREDPGKASRNELMHGLIMLTEFCKHGREYTGDLIEYRRFLARFSPIRKDEDIERYLAACRQYFAEEDPYLFTEQKREIDGNIKTSEEEEIEEWLRIVKEEGRKIHPDTAEVGSWREPAFNPYCLPNNNPEEYCVIEKYYFARAPGSDIWVEFGDLPPRTKLRLYEKHGL